MPTQLTSLQLPSLSQLLKAVGTRCIEEGHRPGIGITGQRTCVLSSCSTRRGQIAARFYYTAVHRCSCLEFEMALIRGWDVRWPRLDIGGGFHCHTSFESLQRKKKDTGINRLIMPSRLTPLAHNNRTKCPKFKPDESGQLRRNGRLAATAQYNPQFDQIRLDRPGPPIPAGNQESLRCEIS
ncbi:hypothetical protein PGT21_029854 [Puccinia graminis f. sp. tritici]|uniref:Uncharacterized protein n=1 Tax=Puccinia graminis f. sp. tritici TaxID=56615 RepID=A0A5B0M0I8_PUCGR|nr:hypothetical protein PGT21_031831 [Puccinia graminis f. sp. tritici]KAA1104687.1 hypothetical protein PGT21_029854 [Puccinia graminis f. sp. tritici]